MITGIVTLRRKILRRGTPAGVEDLDSDPASVAAAGHVTVPVAAAGRRGLQVAGCVGVTLAARRLRGGKRQGAWPSGLSTLSF